MPETFQPAATAGNPEAVYIGAVREMTTYILGAQPQNLARHFHGRSQPNRDPRNPDNTNPSSWAGACFKLARSTGEFRPVRAGQLLELIAEASAAAYVDAQNYGLDLPLTPPKRITAMLNQPGWEDLGRWYAGSNDSLG